MKIKLNPVREVLEGKRVVVVDDSIVRGTTSMKIVKMLKDAGAKGTLLGHSEHKLDQDTLAKSVELGKAVGLKIMICVDSLSELKHSLPLQPDFIAYEPPELIGGQVSVASAQPDIIKQATAISAHLPLIVGAGVHTPLDIKTSLALGAKGVLVASDILTAADPEKELTELADAFRLSL